MRTLSRILSQIASWMPFQKRPHLSVEEQMLVLELNQEIPQQENRLYPAMTAYQALAEKAHHLPKTPQKTAKPRKKAKRPSPKRPRPSAAKKSKGA